MDEAQEHNIKDIKVTYHSEGPSVHWEYLQKLHPAIHLIRAIAKHVEHDFGTISCGMKHTVPKKDKDVRILQESYHKSGYHHRKNGRKADQVEDCTSRGVIKLQTGKFLGRWQDLRTFERATNEEWDSLVAGAVADKPMVLAKDEV